MERYSIVAAILALSFLMCSMSVDSIAQEEEEREYSWGIVDSISSDQIVISEYDPDSDREIEVIYAIDPNAEINNVSSLEEITVGDNVEVDFVVKDGKKVVKVISVEKASYEEEYTPSEECKE